MVSEMRIKRELLQSIRIYQDNKELNGIEPTNKEKRYIKDIIIKIYNLDKNKNKKFCENMIKYYNINIAL